MSRIILQRLIVQGVSYRRTIIFNEGFTIISGEKTSGKSLVLSLIDYCLGKTDNIDLTVQKELDAFCDQVFLELRINDEVLTLNRLLKERQSKIGIYFCSFKSLDEYTPKILDLKDAMQILMQKLNISEYKVIRHQRHSTKKELETISFRDIFRYVYIHQHELGTGDFLEKKNIFKSNKNPDAFKLMFSLVEIDKDILSVELVETQNEIEETRREISGLNSYLKDKDAEDHIILQAKSDKVNASIKDHQRMKSSIIQDGKMSSSENNENKMYIKLKKELENISNKVFEHQHEKRNLQHSITSKMLLLEEYKVEEMEVNETLELNYKLVIPHQSIECPLCNSIVSDHQDKKLKNPETTEKMLIKMKRELNSKINLINDLIEDESSEIEKIDKQINELVKKQDIFNEAIIEFSKLTEVPFLSQIDSINTIIHGLIKKSELVKEDLRIHHKIVEKEKHIDNLKKTESRLIKDIDKLQIDDKERIKTFDYLDTEYKEFMKRLKYNTAGETYIHQEKLIPFYNGASVYSHESGGLLECMQISYLGAILKSKTKGYGTGHPGILMLDSLSKYVGTLKSESQTEEDFLVEKESDIKVKDEITDPEVYEELYKILIELSTDYQVILVENTPPAQFGNIYTKYTFYEGEKGLINEDSNELENGLAPVT